MSERFSKFNNPRTEALKACGFDISGPRDSIQNQEMFTEPVVNSVEKIYDGVIFEQKHTTLDTEGAHTNRYSITFQENNPGITCGIEIKNNPLHIKRLLVNDPNTLCAINGGFFLLVDETLEKPPTELAFGTIIRNGVVRGIQSHDYPVLWIDKQSKLNVTEVQSQGLIKIRDSKYHWTGVNSDTKDADDVLLFSVDSCTVKHSHDEKTGTRRGIDKEKSFTPIHTNVTDLVCKVYKDHFVVIKKNKGGGTFILDGDVVLQSKTSDFNHINVGDKTELTYNNFDIESATQAITIGPSIFKFEHETSHPINYDKSLGDKPPFTERRMARTIIYKTKEDKLVFELFDGAPKTNLFQGASPNEVYKILTTELDNIEWGYFLDPGQSARLVIRHSDNSIQGYGNRHYVRWPKLPNHPFVWSGEHGRPTPSAITLKRNQKQS